MQHQEQKYIDALLNNDHILIREIYDRFYGKIVAMVIKNNGTESDAADIFQEALLSIFHNARSKDFTLTCPLDAFLYLICKNKWINELNKRKLSKVTFFDVEGYSSVGDEIFQQAEILSMVDDRKKLLNDKLNELADGCKQLLQLSWSGKSMEEVAEKLQVTYGYARKKKSECISKLIMLVKSSPKFKSLKW